MGRPKSEDGRPKTEVGRKKLVFGFQRYFNYNFENNKFV
jgi:hypothetical protein